MKPFKLFLMCALTLWGVGLAGCATAEDPARALKPMSLPPKASAVSRPSADKKVSSNNDSDQSKGG